MDYNGPLGCRGRYFDADYPDGVPLDFRYSGHDAYLFTSGALYHLGTPIRSAHALHWSENVDGTHVVVTVDCPLPPAALSPVSAAAPPDACSLLTRALAVQTLGRGVGRAEPVTNAPGDTTCIYQTSELTIVSLEVRDAASIERDPLWRSPAVGGLGVPAHAASNPDGLLVVKGGVGIELIVGLGGSVREVRRPKTPRPRCAWRESCWQCCAADPPGRQRRPLNQTTMRPPGIDSGHGGLGRRSAQLLMDT